MAKKKTKETGYSNKFAKKFLIWFWTIILGFFILIGIYFLLTSKGVFGTMPTFEQLENPNENLATKIYSSDLELIGTYFRENRMAVSYEDLSPYLVDALIATEDVRFHEHSGVDFRALPRVFAGMIGSSSRGGGSTISQQLAKMLFPRKESMSKPEIVHRKFQEWIIAIKLEKNYTKEEIITMYLNKFDFLNLAVGIESASRVYFCSTPDSLKIQQAAMLIGMAQNPSLYNPLRRPDETLHRRNVVLSQMMKYDYLSREEFDSLKLLPLDINYQKVDHNIGQATYFREFLRLWLTAKKPEYSNYIDKRDYIEDSINWYSDPSYGWCNKNTKPDGTSYDIYKDGLQIYTTINSRMQKYAEEAVADHMGNYIQPEFFKDQKTNKRGPFGYDVTDAQIEQIMQSSMMRTERWRTLKASGLSEDSIKNIFNTPIKMSVFSWNGDIDTVMTPMDSLRYCKYYLRASFMSMEPNTGYVRAYVGGINYKHFKFDQVTKARRQVGSTVKPFIYCLAMQNGYSPCHKVPNIEVTFKLPKGSSQEYYTPKYSPSKLDGQMITIKQGLALSLNQISAWVLKQFSPQAAVNIAKKMGVNSHIDPYPSICVGAAEVLLSEMVGAYCTFANKGIYTRPMYMTHIEDKNGNVLATFSANQSEAISEETAYLMIDLMKGVVDMGTSVRLRTKYELMGELAGKTGTTNNHSDGWFMGIAPELVSGAWVGGEERSIRFRYMNMGQGAVLALPIWALYMQKVYDDPKLPYSRDARFERPTQPLSVEINCEEYEKNRKNSDFNQ
ncbi:MAG: transglycosylase domain-containing protein [Bacteroidales bacterium]|jgi:penicillin-binding protein 1A|nr:transglycosylase domain-containing protein [Bacteroidales bacterium]